MNFDRYLFDQEGPHEAFNEFLCSYGYQYSDFIMEKIVPTDVFSREEVEVLTKIENLMAKLLSEHLDVNSWDNLKKDEYLKIKSLSHDYLTIVYDLNNY